MVAVIILFDVLSFQTNLTSNIKYTYHDMQNAKSLDKLRYCYVLFDHFYYIQINFQYCKFWIYFFCNIRVNINRQCVEKINLK